MPSAPQRLGRALAFLFNWQFLLYAPCLLASGYIGFANYAAYLYPPLGSSVLLHDAVALGIGVVTIAAALSANRRVVAARNDTRGCGDTHGGAGRARRTFACEFRASLPPRAVRSAWARGFSPASAPRSTSRSTTTSATRTRRCLATRSCGRSARFPWQSCSPC